MLQDLMKKTLDAVFLVSQCFANTEDAHETVKKILGILNEALEYRYGTVTLLEPESGDLLVEASHGIQKDRIKDIRYHKGEGVTGLILETARPLAIPRVGNDPRFLNRLGVYNADSAFLGVPIMVNGAVQGVLTVSAPSSERYRLDDHLKVVSLFANLVGGVITRLARVEKEKEEIIREKDALQGQLKNKFRPDNMVGASKLMEDVFENVRQVAKWSTTVLVRGESGTGKELVAKAIHYQSVRSSGPFVKLNCAALPDTLLESELFGHEMGAFTGAARSRPGRFELADKGTLFLDEIGDTSAAFQTRLLRVLQEGQFERLGGDETFTVDVRVIAATHVDLERAVAEERFREDLYYRLNVMPIYLPPLRERKEDIPYLVEFFLDKLGKECGKRFAIEPEAMRALQECLWPGNVRELENCVNRCAVVCKDHRIRKDDVPCTHAMCPNQLIYSRQAAPKKAEGEDALLKIENERDRIIEALKQSGWVQAKAARLLKMTPRQIAYRIQRLHIEVNR